MPVQRFRAVRGALLLSTQAGDIDAIIAAERFALLQVFLVAALVMIVLSMLLAGTIAGPVRRLAEAAERVRRGIKSREEIPDFTDRSDEIGHLSGALRDMTRALYNRIEAIESFAADVAHELKNPLTSLRSAVETLPLAQSDESRARLLAIIQHDVRRLDRLITDISDASRLDAELARADAEPVDMAQLLETVVAIANERRREHDPRDRARASSRTDGQGRVLVIGHDSRLARCSATSSTMPAPSRRADGTVAGYAPARPRRDRDRRRGRRAGHPAARARAHLRALLHRPAGPGLRPEFRPRPVDLAPDRRGASRPHRAENRLGPPGADGEPRRLGARFSRPPAAARLTQADAGSTPPASWSARPAS